MPNLPSGTVTFLFTDIEQSTRLLDALGERYEQVLADHHRLLRSAFEAHDGYEVDTQGDSFFVAFASARQALAAAVDAQRALAAYCWPGDRPLRVRMGLHTGEAQSFDGGYVGMDIHRAARISAAAHGGQIILSDRTRSLVEPSLPPGATLSDLGHHRLKDLAQEEHLHQVSIEGLSEVFPPPASLSRPSSLPSMPTGFVGRRHELAALEKVLARPDVRVLTLTGAGGSGKTRLALEAAAHMADWFPGGTFFVPLAPVRDHEVVASTIAEVLGLREIGERRVLELVKGHLRDRHALLVLDNFEHVHEAAPVVAELLAAAPRVCAVVTSRSPLRIYGEHEMPVPPMSLPPGNDDATAIAGSEAVQLFVERARAVAPGFELTAENAGAIADIVARIDGLPLAIELAASRVRLLTPHELAGRLDRRLRLLTGGATDLPDRQRTLRATIDWSYRLLDADEQAVFRRLSCFVGGCTIETATAVVDPDGALPFDMLDGIASLVDKSLLWRQQRTAAATRFVMLETLREFAREQLDAHDESSTVRRRHAIHHRSLADRAREALDAGDLSEMDRFDQEHDNLIAALEWAVNTDDSDGGEIALGLVSAMGWYWYTRGHTQVAALWLERALERGAHAPALARAKPLYWFGAILDRRGDLDRARAAMQASVERWREVGDTDKLATALNGLGAVAENQGDFDFATATYEESLGRYREADDDHGVATVLCGLGTVAAARGDAADAERLLTESLHRFTGTGDSWSIAVVEADLAWVVLDAGRPDEAATLARDATRRFREWGEQTYLARCLELHAAITAPQRPEVGARLLGAAHGLRETVGATLSDRDRERLDRHLMPARHRLDDAFADEFAAGAATPLDEVLDSVL